MRASYFSLVLLAGACTPARPAAPAIEPAPPGLAPGQVEAYVRVDGCQAGRCDGTVVEIAGRGPSAPVLTNEAAVHFALGADEEALRQGTLPAFRPGAVLRLVLTSEDGALGAPGPSFRVAAVRTPGLSR